MRQEGVGQAEYIRLRRHDIHWPLLPLRLYLYRFREDSLIRLVIFAGDQSKISRKRSPEAFVNACDPFQCVNFIIACDRIIIFFRTF